VLIRYIRAVAGELGVLQVLAIAGEFRSAQALETPDTFSSHQQAVTLFHAAAQVTGDGNVGLHVGERMIRQYAGTEVEAQFRALGSVEAMVGNVVASVSRVTAMVTAQAISIGDNHTTVKVMTRPGLERHPHFCEFTKGMLSQIPVPFGAAPAGIVERECQAQGGRFCLYSVSWVDTDRKAAVRDDEAADQQVYGWGAAAAAAPSELQIDDHTRIAQLAGQLRQMDERLEGVFSTASELLGGAGIDTLLTRITSQAARAVSASRYLLVVRTSPDADIQLHHHGFNPDEAAILADELWKEHPDDDGGARLIVDIASARRRYGRLAAVYPPGVTYFESERRMLALYAGYAATALDMVTSLEDARQSDTTARELLRFSGALSRVSTTDEAAQLLADTVPAVVGCQHGTVLLWSPEFRQLSVRATSSEHTETDNQLSDPEDTIETVVVSAATPVLEHLIGTRGLAVIDRSTSDADLRSILLKGAIATSVLAPLFAGDEFLGLVAANFNGPVQGATVRRGLVHERLSGLADQAVTALQNVRLLEQISHVAWHDALTGLPNRRLLEDRVEQEMVRGRRVGESACLFFVDLDRFKAVNDTMGHSAGDELIRQVAARLVDTVRRQDTVARLGGDEFAVLLPGLAEAGPVQQLAQRCLEAISTPYEILGREVRTSASIGIAITPEHGQSYGELLTKADEAMYRSKARGRNTCAMYTDGASGAAWAPASISDLDMEVALHHAIESGELFVLYQPYVDLETTRVVGVEALVRWKHPTLGILEPEVFVRQAELTGAIGRMDAWVLSQACRQLGTWAEEGLSQLRLSVNVASQDLDDPSMVPGITGSLAAGPLDPGLLELEIAGSEKPSSATAIDNLHALSQMGVTVTFDRSDRQGSATGRFGTFPLATLKIDRSFVQVLGPEGSISPLIAAITASAKQLGLDCATTGIGQPKSRVLLQRGATTAQGFFFSPPLLPGDVPRMLAEGPGSGPEEHDPGTRSTGPMAER
jgi:diguanylate cyclase (GGDEF)-like protein